MIKTVRQLKDLIRSLSEKKKRVAECILIFILKGVRQVCKTWVLKEFGRRCYENTAYFNFDENEEYRQFFETTNFPCRQSQLYADGSHDLYRISVGQWG